MRTLARAADRANLQRRLRRLQADSPARWGRMTAPQMVCHLSDALRMAMGRKEVSPATGWFQRTLLKWIVLYLPLQWPADVTTRPEIDQQLGGTRPDAFARDVEDLQALLEAFTTHAGGSPPHPMFGPLSRRQWLRWAYLHADHHFRQFGV